MKRLGTVVTTALMMGVLLVAVSGCEKGSAEKVGESIDDSVEKIGKSIKETGESIQDAGRDAAD